MGWLTGWLVIVICGGWIGFVLWVLRKEMKRGDLPEGARKYEGPFNEVLRIAHEKRHQVFRKTGKIIKVTAEMFKDFGAFSSREIWWDPERKGISEKSRKFFNCKVCPQVDGISWYDAICIPVKEGFVLLYEPWVAEGTFSQPNIIYTLGEVTQEELEQIFATFSESFAKLMPVPQ